MISLFLIAMSVASSGFSAESAGSLGVVNFGTCITDSKLGKQEQAAFEAMKNQMTALVEDTEKQLTELSAKFNDPEYLDGLSPEAEEEMKNKFRVLNEDMGRYQNQYYQVLNQANMKIIQTLSGSINSASEKIAKEKKLAAVVNKDACFFYAPALDITSNVIAEMDKNFEVDSKKSPAVAPNSLESKPAA